MDHISKQPAQTRGEDEQPLANDKREEARIQTKIVHDHLPIPASDNNKGPHRFGLDELVIDPEFEACVPPLKPEELAQLEANILREGECHVPLVVWGEIIIDGHARHKICLKHPHIRYTTKSHPFPNRETAKIWIGENHLGRRNLTDDQRAYVWSFIEEARSAIAATAQRRIAGKASAVARSTKANGRAKSAHPLKPVESLNPERKRTRTAIAKEANLPEKKLRQMAEIKAVSADLAIMVRDCKITLRDRKRLAALPDESRRNAIKEVNIGVDVRAAVREAKKVDYIARIALTRPKPLEGTYRIFYVDPPWKYHGLNQADEYGHAEAR